MTFTKSPGEPALGQVVATTISPPVALVVEISFIPETENAALSRHPFARRCGFQGVRTTSSPSRSTSSRGVSHSGQWPPKPIARENRLHSGQRRSPTSRSKQLGHS
jgi:hypothetical protein